MAWPRTSGTCGGAGRRRSNFAPRLPFRARNLRRGKQRASGRGTALAQSDARHRRPTTSAIRTGMTALAKVYRLATLCAPLAPWPALPCHGQLICELYDQGLRKPGPCPRVKTSDGGDVLSPQRGIMRAVPEAAHRLAGEIREAQAAKGSPADERVILLKPLRPRSLALSDYDASSGVN